MTSPYSSNPGLPIFQGAEYPALCINMGLTCETCVAESAHHLASTCHGLRPPAVRQLFVQIYPDPACSAMAAEFERAYKRASGINQPAAFVEMPAMPRVAVKAMATVA